MAFSHTALHGQLVVNSISLMAPWVRVRNLHTLLAGGESRGENATVDGLAGEVAEEWTWDATDYDLEVVVVGDVLHSGSASVPEVGIATNIAYLRTNLWKPHTSYSVTLTTPNSGSTLTGTAQVRTFDVGAWSKTAVAVSMTLRVLSGVLS